MTRTEQALLGRGAPVDRPSPRPGAHAGICRGLAPPPHPLALRMIVGRSLFPIVSLVLIAGTLLWGPWVTLVLALVVWNVVGRFG